MSNIGFTKKEKAKIQARYNAKFEEFTKLSKETLATIYDSKMSSTDRKAFDDATNYLIWREKYEQASKESETSENTDVLSTEDSKSEEVGSNMQETK